MTRMRSLLSAVAVCSLASVLAAAEAPKAPDALKAAAEAPKAAATANVVKPTGDVKSWRLEQHEEAKGTIAAADGAIAFEVTKDDGTDWHLQAFQTPLDLKDGTAYVVTFQAKADAADRPVKLSGGIDEDDWHSIGLDEEVMLGKEFKAYEFKFTAADTRPMKNRIGFVLGMAKGKVWVKDLSVTAAAKK